MKKLNIDRLIEELERFRVRSVSKTIIPKRVGDVKQNFSELRGKYKFKSQPNLTEDQLIGKVIKGQLVLGRNKDVAEFEESNITYLVAYKAKKDKEKGS